MHTALPPLVMAQHSHETAEHDRADARPVESSSDVQQGMLEVLIHRGHQDVVMEQLAIDVWELLQNRQRNSRSHASGFLSAQQNRLHSLATEPVRKRDST